MTRARSLTWAMGAVLVAVACGSSAPTRRFVNVHAGGSIPPCTPRASSCERAADPAVAPYVGWWRTARVEVDASTLFESEAFYFDGCTARGGLLPIFTGDMGAPASGGCDPWAPFRGNAIAIRPALLDGSRVTVYTCGWQEWTIDLAALTVETAPRRIDFEEATAWERRLALDCEEDAGSLGLPLSFREMVDGALRPALAERGLEVTDPQTLSWMTLEALWWRHPSRVRPTLDLLVSRGEGLGGLAVVPGIELDEARHVAFETWRRSSARRMPPEGEVWFADPP